METLHTSGALDFVAATQGMPFHYLILVTRSACIPRFHGTVAIGEVVLGTPRALCRQYTEAHSPILFLKEASWLVLQLWVRTDFRSGIYLVAYRDTLKEHSLWMPSWCSLLPCSSLPVSPRKGHMHLFGALIFVTVA